MRVLTEKMGRLHWVPFRLWAILFEWPSLSVSGALIQGLQVCVLKQSAYEVTSSPSSAPRAHVSQAQMS